MVFYGNQYHFYKNNIDINTILYYNLNKVTNFAYETWIYEYKSICADRVVARVESRIREIPQDVGRNVPYVCRLHWGNP